MFRCPRCNAELPAEARFCRFCGFNAPNAAPGFPPAAVGPGNAGMGTAPGMAQPFGGAPGMPPPQPSAIPPRTIQVENKHVLPAGRQMPVSSSGTAPAPLAGGRSASKPVYPSSPSMGNQPAPPANAGSAASLIRPVEMQPPKRPTPSSPANAPETNPPVTPRRISGTHLVARTPLPPTATPFQPTAPGMPSPSIPPTPSATGAAPSPAAPQSMAPQTPRQPVSTPGVAQPGQSAGVQMGWGAQGAAVNNTPMARPPVEIVRDSRASFRPGRAVERALRASLRRVKRLNAGARAGASASTTRPGQPPPFRAGKLLCRSRCS